MKLVRDNIPNIIQSKGDTAKTHIANKKEFEEALIAKLEEELKEVKEDRNIEEIADLIEVALTLAKEYGATEEEINELRKKKNLKNGAFEKRIILE
ncbi:MAG: nucleoside triphosphate pyrophosphohydrolase [archaeon]|jgi:predicted house-cleaning noncanonical NTP pyrophosphatase (MazG superfamily)